MIRPAIELSDIYLCVEPVDFRKHINGLAALVQDELGADPFAEGLFVFTNRRRNQVRILVWERNGYVLWAKRLERERFHWPRASSAVVTLSGQELNWLLDGLDLSKWRPHQPLSYRYVA